MRNPRNTVVVSIGSGPGAARVRELFTEIAEGHFGSRQSTLLAEMARELVMAFKVEDKATAEKLGLFREAMLGPHICREVVKAYDGKGKRIQDEYLGRGEAVDLANPNRSGEGGC